MKYQFSTFFSQLLQAIFPSTCACCDEVLVSGERQICLHCLTSLSRTCYSSHDENHTERLLGGRIHNLQHATSLFTFHKDNTVA